MKKIAVIMVCIFAIFSLGISVVFATENDLSSADPSQTPEPTAITEQTPVPSSDPAITAEPEVTVTPAVTAEPGVTVTPAVTAEPEVTVTPTVTNEPETTVTPTVSAEPLQSPEPTVTPADTVTPLPDSTPVTSPSDTPAPSISPVASASPSPTITPGSGDGSGISITPDSLLYPVKRMIESIQVALTFSPDGKANLLIKLANERIGEAAIMNSRNKPEMVMSLLKTYVKTVSSASDYTQQASDAGKDVGNILDSIKVVEDTADSFSVQITGTIPPEKTDALKTAITKQVTKTVAVDAKAAASENLRTANEKVEQAHKDVAAAAKTNDPVQQKAATDELQQAQQNKDVAKQTKKAVYDYSAQIIKSTCTKPSDNVSSASGDVTNTSGDESDNTTKTDDESDKANVKKNPKCTTEIAKVDEEKQKAEARLEKKYDKQKQRIINKENKKNGNHGNSHK